MAPVVPKKRARRSRGLIEGDGGAGGVQEGEGGELVRDLAVAAAAAGAGGTVVRGGGGAEGDGGGVARKRGRGGLVKEEVVVVKTEAVGGGGEWEDGEVGEVDD